MTGEAVKEKEEMCFMKSDYYKKSGVIMMSIARDFMLMSPGDRIPTILEYTQKFSSSRGIIQKTLASLESSGCVKIEKRGIKGTFLVHIDYKRLYEFTNLGSLIGTMPLPLNPYLSSLTTAISEELEQASFPFSFAYVTGAKRRLEGIKNQIYDFMVISQNTANIYLKKYDFLELCLVLKHCRYSPRFMIYFFSPDKNRIEDGMRIGIDRKCTDQMELTKYFCQGKKVEYVEFPYVAFEDLMKNRNVDCVIYREMDWAGEVPEGYYFKQMELPPLPGYTEEEVETPVILTHKENYGVDRLLRKYIHPEEMEFIQKEVMQGKRAMKYY